MKDSLFSQNTEYLQTLLSEHQDIGIVIGEPHSIDKVGAGLALYLSLIGKQKNTQVISRKEPIVEVSNLVGVDKLKKSFDGLINTLTISVPYQEGEVEKVSYNIEGNRLNVNLVATSSGITFSEKDVQFIKKGAAPSLIFAVGVANPNDLITMVGDTSTRVVNIDNKELNQLYGDILYVDREFSSISEIVGKIIESLGLPIDVDIAQDLIDGIAQATNNFTSPHTSAFAFEVMAHGLKNGARRKQTRQEEQQPSLQQQQRPQMGFDRQRQQQSQQQRHQQRQQQPQQQRHQQQQQPRSQQIQSSQSGQNQPQQPQGNRMQEVVSQPQAELAPMNSPIAQPQPVSLPQQPPSQPAPIQPVVQSQPQPLQSQEPEVPQDWFTPKIFRGGKSGDENN